MAPTLVHLPNGQTLSVSPVFAGLSFKANDLNVHHSVFPPGWTILIESEDELEPESSSENEAQPYVPRKRSHIHRFRTPTLHNDNLFISSISNPSNVDFKPATSPTRQIAMMLWATLYWYFHQPPPNPHLSAGVSPNTPEAGRPKGDWRVNIKREGIFKSKLLFPKLERMGLISTEESCVGTSTDDRSGHGWKRMFVSQRAFWQLDARIFLFTLTPTAHSPFPGTTPLPSRPSSPNRDTSDHVSPKRTPDIAGMEPSHGMWSHPSPGPFASASHLPTFYPPPPPQYIITNGVRHPVRPKPPAQGQVFYTRHIQSVGQFLSFRTASLSTKAPPHRGPMSGGTPPNFLPPSSGVSSSTLPTLGNITISPSDLDLLHDWMNNPRVNAAWGVAGPIETQETFLKENLKNKHSFPVIGCWDGKPFGYFEIYWVKEDQLGRHVDSRGLGNWDRGIHVLVGEEGFRGEHRVKVWLSALVHYCWLADQRTENVFLEPRVDNEKFISYLHKAGFHKEREFAFPHKQAALMKISRDAWDAPAL